MARTVEQRVLGDGFRGPRFSDTQWAQIRMIQAGSDCEYCGIKEASTLCGSIRVCPTCALIIDAARRQEHAQRSGR